MAVNDIIEGTLGWPIERARAVDHLLEREGLPSLTEMRLGFSKDIQRVLKRGSIKNEIEYYAIRNALDLAKDDEQALLILLAAYEQRDSG